MRFSKKNLALMALGLSLALAAGCATKAEEHFVKVQLGMSKAQVRGTIGEPDIVKKVRFEGHTKDYEIWEYDMVPQTPT